MPAGGSCLLASINLSAFVTDPFTANAKFDYESFRKAVDIVVREMNVILDEGLPLHPLQEQRESVAKWRQIGLGILGLADALIKMGLTYGNYPSLVVSERIGKEMAQQAMLTSALLAKEHGAYPGCDIDAVLRSEYFTRNANEEITNLVKEYGLRNSQLLTIAPTGSISTMLGVSGGVEPIFATKFFRTTKSLHGKDVSYEVYADIVKQCMEAYNADKIPSHIVTAMDLDSTKRIKMQATWQKYIDAAISSTINLPQETTVDDVFNIYVEAWKNGLKGCTVYRAGCEREGILTVEHDSEETHIESHDHACPECGSELIAVNGCFECQNCGWGKCSL